MTLLQHGDLIRHPQTGGMVELAHLVEMVTRRVPPPYSETSGQTVAAYVSHGRWVADCPHGDGGALMVDLRMPRFICPKCANWRVDGLWHEVILPEDFDEIERLLEIRPDIITRSWRSPETMDDLRAENIEHGLPV